MVGQAHRQTQGQESQRGRAAQPKVPAVNSRQRHHQQHAVPKPVRLLLPPPPLPPAAAQPLGSSARPAQQHAVVNSVILRMRWCCRRVRPAAAAFKLPFCVCWPTLRGPARVLLSGAVPAVPADSWRQHRVLVWQQRLCWRVFCCRCCRWCGTIKKQRQLAKSRQSGSAAAQSGFSSRCYPQSSAPGAGTTAAAAGAVSVVV